jgi:hypothetical protein
MTTTVHNKTGSREIHMTTTVHNKTGSREVHMTTTQIENTATCPDKVVMKATRRRISLQQE